MNDQSLITIVERNFRDCVQSGTAILRYQDQKVSEIAAQASLIEWEEFGMIPVVNTSCLMSEVANLLLEQYPESKFSLYWYDRNDGMRQWGLRSREDFDVSEVAKRYGGGGHHSAAGFITKAGAMPKEVG